MDSESKGQLTRSPSAFLREQEAAVTVFFFIVGGALLMMFLAVFNYGRYLLAVRQAEKALEASAVSVLSYYQPTLTREMGLFALDVRNLFLPEIGKAYFVDNLGPPGAVNGQQCLEYSISFPEGSRLALNNILMAQAVDMKRIEGWTGLGLDILELFNLTDWMNAFGASGDDAEVMDALGLSALVADAGEAGNTNGIVEGATDIVGGMTDSATEGASGNSAAEYPDWLKTMDENANRSEGSNLKIWQLLMPNPPDERFSNRRLPRTAASIWDGLDTLASGSVDFWQDTLTNPISAVQAVGFFSRTIEKIEEFMSDFSGNIIRVLEQARDKIVFDEYLLQELDFATNKPVLNRYFSRCEVEYVLCGLNSAWDNVRVTALYILLLRTCIYLVDALIQGKIKDRATLVKEALQALIKGSEDVEKLYAGQRIPIYPQFSQVKMSYKDHLMLFLFCQGEATQRRALQNIVQANLWHWSGGSSGTNLYGNDSSLIDASLGAMTYDFFDLQNYATEVHVVAETEVSLWPFGAVRIKREGVMGYDRPFEMLSPG